MGAWEGGCLRGSAPAYPYAAPLFGEPISRGRLHCVLAIPDYHPGRLGSKLTMCTLMQPSPPLLHAQALDPSELGMAVSLSVGELSRADYVRLFEAGTRR